jgi:hypothetical protein
MTEKKHKTFFPRIVIIIVSGFFLNLLWEVLHSLLYDWNKAPLVNDIYVYIPRIVFGASCMDAFWIMIITCLNILLRRGLIWLREPQKRDYITFFCIGLIIAIFIELQAFLFNQWSYNQYMPVIFGIGLTPFLQLGTTACISLFISTKIKY